MTGIEENIAHIGYRVGERGFVHGSHKEGTDFMQTTTSIIKWAHEFEELHKDTDWEDEESEDYWIAIDEFTDSKMKQEVDAGKAMIVESLPTEAQFLEKPRLGNFRYRDASNNNFPFEAMCDLNLKVDQELTYRNLGFTPLEFHKKIVKYPYDPDSDHEIVTFEGWVE